MSLNMLGLLKLTVNTNRVCKCKVMVPKLHRVPKLHLGYFVKVAVEILHVFLETKQFVFVLFDIMHVF